MRALVQKLLKGSSAIAVAQMVANISAFLLPWAIARGMGESDYGLYAAAYALAVSLAAIADTGVRVTLIREVSRTPELWKFLVKYALIISVVLACLVALVFAVVVMIQDDNSDTIQLRFWLFGYALLWTAMRISLGAAVGQQRLVASAVWGSLERLGGTVLVVFTAFSPNASLIFIAQELLFWEAFVLIVLWWWLLKQRWGTTYENPLSITGFAKTAIPFGVAAVAAGLLGRLDLAILGFQRKPEEVAMYASGQTLSFTLVFVGIAIASALFPMISSLGKEKDSAVARALIEPSVSLLAMMLLIGGTFIAAGAEMWMVNIYGEGFAQGSKWLILYAVMSPVYALGAVMGAVIAAWGRQADYARWSVGALLIAGPSYWMASQWLGMEGVALCVIITQWVMTARAWAWMVEDGLVGDRWWFGKLALLQLLLIGGITLSAGVWDWLFVPIAAGGAMLMGVCRWYWLKRLKQFLFSRV
ncbi:MAG: lipopolysaccharide biosynthesis protein [Mariprofundaceae bacterium]